MLTRSPATMPWFVAPRVTAASPVSTPARASRSGPRPRTASTSSSAGPDGALGVVLVGDRGAPHGHHGVADELLDGPAVPLDRGARRVEVAGQQLADGLGVAVLGQRREADKIGEQDGDEATLGDGRVRRPRTSAVDGRPAHAQPCAAAEQKLASARFGSPQPGQADASGVPQLSQNLLPLAVVGATGRAAHPRPRCSGGRNVPHACKPRSRPRKLTHPRFSDTLSFTTS